MTEFAEREPRSKVRKLVLQAIAGAICGFVGMFGVMFLVERGLGDLPPPETAIALGVALIYLLMGLAVGIGALAPSFGAKALNVEDSEELIEERGNLLYGATSFVFTALLLFALALIQGNGEGILLSREVSLWLATGAASGLVVTAFLGRKRGDELMKAAEKEAGASAMTLTFVTFGSWAVLHQLGLVPMFSALLFVSGLFALYLLAVFVAAGQRGMLRPR